MDAPNLLDCGSLCSEETVNIDSSNRERSVPRGYGTGGIDRMAKNAVLLRYAEPGMLVARAHTWRSDQTEHI